MTAAAEDDALFYEVRDQAIVFTNTPSASSKRLSAWDGRAETLPAANDLPATRFDAVISRAARGAGLPGSLVKAVVWAESGFDPRAVSPKGAMGLMQLMPATAASYGVTQPFDPEQNLRAGATHLRKMMDQFEGDLNLALAAYNAGAGTVRRYGGIPDYPETQNYVSKIRSHVATKTMVRNPIPSVAIEESTISSLRLSRGSDGTVHIEN